MNGGRRERGLGTGRKHRVRVPFRSRQSNWSTVCDPKSLSVLRSRLSLRCRSPRGGVRPARARTASDCYAALKRLLAGTSVLEVGRTDRDVSARSRCRSYASAAASARQLQQRTISGGGVGEGGLGRPIDEGPTFVYDSRHAPHSIQSSKPPTSSSLLRAKGGDFVASRRTPSNTRNSPCAPEMGCGV